MASSFSTLECQMPYHTDSEVVLRRDPCSMELMSPNNSQQQIASTCMNQQKQIPKPESNFQMTAALVDILSTISGETQVRNIQFSSF